MENKRKEEEEFDAKETSENEKYSSKPVQYTTNFANHMDHIFNDFAERGGLDNLKGEGKPLEISNGSVLDSVLKNANYLPKWVELQKEIRAQILAAIQAMDKSNDHSQIRNEIDAINLKIQKYNLIVPAPVLQKGLISIENIKRKYSNWE
ncbi:DUF1992 domain-containing protein [Neobacillus mesonae]|nr:DUF1992 domain-containing protein [Neobacillus mesonae]